MDKDFTIGRLAKAAGVNIQTIYYYERTGLLKPAGRRKAGYHQESGYRLYNEDSLKRLCFICHAKELGFTLKEIKELLNLSVSPAAKCEDIRKKTEERLIDVDKKIKGLKSIRRILKSLIKSCRNRQSTDPCPILKAIDEEGWKV